MSKRAEIRSTIGPRRDALGVIWDAPLPELRREHHRIGYALAARATAGTMIAAIAVGGAPSIAGEANAGVKPVITLPADSGGEVGDEGVAAPGQATPEDAPDEDGLTAPVAQPDEPEPPEPSATQQPPPQVAPGVTAPAQPPAAEPPAQEAAAPPAAAAAPEAASRPSESA